MISKATTVEEYLKTIPEERKEAMNKLRKLIVKSLPKGFAEQMNYGMIGYVVPHKLYPEGYHCDPKLPLPFLGLASQKNTISFYHMGIYADPILLDWFVKAYASLGMGKLDMGKSCMRFKKPEQIPYALLGELIAKVTVKDWIALYEKNYKR